MYMKNCYLIMLILILASENLLAKVLLPQVLSSNMVLQREKPLTIWGFAAPGEKITVNFAEQAKNATANSSGNWEVTLAPLKASAVPRTMQIKGTNKIELTNILVGEVWLCSGQSNMEYAMRKLVKIPRPLNEKLGFPQNEVEKADNNQIRIFLVNRKTLSRPDSVHQSWSIARDSALRAFSAAGYFFAKELQEKLQIPVGIIESAVSGSAIEPWISKEALLGENYFAGKKIDNDPGKFYGPMIQPLSKFKLRGFLWYQGETNCFLKENISYSYKMKTLISLWRDAWNDRKAPFYFVQLAPYNYSRHSGKVPLNENTEPEFWEAQAQLLRLPATGMVVTTDLNDDGEDLHPTYKWEIGRRLSLLALAKDYGKPVVFSAPVFKKAVFIRNEAVLTFDHIQNAANIKGKSLTGFEIAGKDGVFYPAEALLKKGNIVVASAQVGEPDAVRFNWTEQPQTNFYSDNGLPVMPFRTNNPLTAQFK